MNSYQKTVVIVSGYFDSFHIGHVALMEKASQLGQQLAVIVNNDIQQEQKNGEILIPEEKRINFVRNIEWVDDVFLSIDTDSTVSKTIEMIVPNLYPWAKDFIFANGGPDRASVLSVPEAEICKKLGIKIVCGIGGYGLFSSNETLVI